MTLQTNTSRHDEQTDSKALVVESLAPQRTVARRVPLYLVGEQDRSATRPAAAPERATLCVNGTWHTMRSDVATFEQIVGLSITVKPGQTVTYLSVMFRRGSPDRPSGSLSPGDVIPVVDGMLFNATATILS